MKIIDLKNETEYILSPEDRISCAIGNFDGVHLGHQTLLALAAKKKPGITKSAVWTFIKPTSRTLCGVSLLSTAEERQAIFRSLGIDLIFLADFETIRDLTPEEFTEKILYEECQVRHAVCGFNFRYGKKAAGTAETLLRDFSAKGLSVDIVPPYQMDGVTVSSSEIRAALAEGNIRRAEKMLSRPYTLTAEIIHGKKLGRTMGFPTANQHFPEGKAVPRFGVYAVRMYADGKVYEGVANVGVRPTVEQGVCANCECYIFDFAGDLYGKTVKTEFCEFLRPEQTFSDIDALKTAISNDMARAKQYFKVEKEFQTI